MKKVLSFLRTQSRTTVAIADSVVIIVSYYLAFMVKFQFNLEPEIRDWFFTTLPIIFVIRFLSFIYFRIYKASWRYASITDLFNIIKSVVISEAVFLAFMVFWFRLSTYPRAVFIYDPLIAVILLGSLRLSTRLFREARRSFKTKKDARRVLIIGASDTGEMVLREMLAPGRFSGLPVAFLDDDREKQGQYIHGIPVVGGIDSLRSTISSMDVDEVIIAIPLISQTLMKKIVSSCEESGARVKIVPALRDLIDGKISISQIRQIDIEDLLGREVVSTDIESISRYLSEKVILVTGAGGSIGGEICRQVLRFNPKALIMFDISENSTQETYSSLRNDARCDLIRVIGSITNRRKLRSVFNDFRPQIVYHAAACKHVDLMEDNPDEAVITNIGGTMNVLEFSKEYRANRVIVISSDKAADPASVMGCTKRVAEMLIQSEGDGDSTICGVRFGNVLGSQGSVVPLFQRQIREGGPVTVTDPGMKRYFMTIPEAVELVIQAGAMGRHKDIFMLDMGEPMKVVDLAKDMIKLSGFREGDIEIKFTGIRKGEKLEETLIGRNERLANTAHPKIMLVQFGAARSSRQEIEAKIGELLNSAVDMQTSALRRVLHELVPEYEEHSQS